MEKRSSQKDQFPEFLLSGSKVEVWSEEDGYDNAWFSCEIVQPPPRSSYTPTGRNRKKRTALIKYDHMLDAGSDKPLVERLDTRFIRPTPPLDSLDQPLELYDVVDAFFNDIWWTGFVAKVVDDRYTVAFKKPLDLQEFRRSDLRLHWDWVDSWWVRPKKEDAMGLIYIPGTEVEVNRHDEVPCHAWLPAIVIGKVGSTHSFLVKYKNSDNDGEEALKEEIVDLELIRPCPPKIEDRDFDVLEKVDAFHGSCWWVGLVTKLLEGKRYIVTLRHKKEMEFSHSELRPHLEWIDRKWVTKSKGVQFTSDCQEQIRLEVQESSGSILDDTEKERHCLSIKQENQKELSPRVEKSPYFRCSNMEKENQICSGEKPIEVISDGDDEKTKQQEAAEMENEAVISAKKKGRRRKSHERPGSTLVDTGNERLCLSDTHDNQKELGPRVENPPDFGCSNMERGNHISSGDKPIGVIPSGDDEKTKKQEAGERENEPVISPKKRGRPRKSHEGSGSTLVDSENERPCLSNARGKQKELSSLVENSLDFECSNMEKENHISSGEKPIGVIPSGDDEKTKKQVAGERENEPVISPKKRGRPRKSHERSGSTLVDSENERPCLSNARGNQKELSSLVENSFDFECSNMEKENHISSGDEPVEAISSGDNETTKKQEAGEIENQAVILTNTSGSRRKSHESSCSTLGDTRDERPHLSNTQDNQKELSPSVENSFDLGCSNMEKQNHISNDDKTVEVISIGDDEKTNEQEAAAVENQAIISLKKRGRSQKSQAFTLWPRKRRRNIPSRSNSKGALQKIADAENMEVNQEMMEAIEACKLIENLEGVNGPHVENSCQFPTEFLQNEQNGKAKTSGEMKGNGENPELLVVNSEGAAGGEEELGGGGGGVADSTTEKSESLAITLTDTMEEDDATQVSPMPVEISSGDQALVMHVEEVHTPTNAAESGKLKYDEDDATVVSPMPVEISSGDQALVMHVEEVHTPTNVAESAIVGATSTDNIVRTDVQNLPFVKNYPVWQTIQSMEVFQNLPQSPKFQPLMKCKELKREGLAISYMLNFANLVDKVSKLQETDPIQDLESMMEELVELEEMGFNITEVRDRVSKLIQFKVMLEKLNHKLNGVEVHIKECSDGKSKIDGEVAEIEKEMKRLEEKQAGLMAKRMETTFKELKLISESHAINRDISRVMGSFGRLVMASWCLAYGG